MDFDKELDARGLNCPLPILRCKKGLAELTGGQVLKVLATDPGSVKDFQAFCKQTGHEMLAMEENTEAPKKEFIFHIKKRTT
ncbi:MAG: sulfurtransferase TusA family protein [Methylophilaceae bacterium]|uniref:sulfurtransferase TusA family protein n=1 Tax=Methylovorus sp. MM2 TaxID=1848038 RepID=UPI0007DFB6EE|nr:sulfurtransferase TusA family protein [Methylovorus sp. MM2]OAM51840.1 preprotein translocase subunit TatC [Methylovorus sp. MM2]